MEEGSISKGIRRVVAITGDRANESIALAKQIEGMLSHARSLHGKELEAAVAELQQTIPAAVVSVASKAHLKEELKAVEKMMMAEKKEAGRVFYTVEGLESANATKLMQKLRELDKEGSYFFFSVDRALPKVSMYALVAKEKGTKTFSAKTWMAAVAAECGGKGGGSPMLAQGQSKDISNVEKAFQKAEEMLKESL